MMNQFFKSQKKIQHMHEGPLGSYIDAYVSLLHEQGYSRQSILHKIRLISDLSRWLHKQGIEADDINRQTIDRYIIYINRPLDVRHGDHSTLNRLLDLMREMGITSANDQVIDKVKSDHQQVEDSFKRYLLEERGLSPTTVSYYILFVRQFLFEQFGTDTIQFNELSAREITGFVQRHAYDFSHGRIQNMLTALRAFLRYLRYQNDIVTDLAACVPTIANWKLSTLPKFLRPEQVQDILRHCDRQTILGRRNYAILLLLARLGLRACEVMALRLEDIDWETGYINIRGKGGRIARLPLPQDVGEAIAAYLQNGRPRCSSRHVFIRHNAPIREFASSGGIRWIVRCAIENAGVDSPHKGAHLFRHTLATQMLRQGASLDEIGELLRHRSPNTTTIYAKVDVTALRALAQPWPGGEL